MVAIQYLVHYDSALQNATDIITKCDSYFITKRDKVYYKMRRFYCKMRQLLQNASIKSTILIKFDISKRLHK